MRFPLSPFQLQAFLLLALSSDNMVRAIFYPSAREFLHDNRPLYDQWANEHSTWRACIPVFQFHTTSPLPQHQQISVLLVSLPLLQDLVHFLIQWLRDLAQYSLRHPDFWSTAPPPDRWPAHLRLTKRLSPMPSLCMTICDIITFELSERCHALLVYHLRREVRSGRNGSVFLGRNDVTDRAYHTYFLPQVRNAIKLVFQAVAEFFRPNRTIRQLRHLAHGYYRFWAATPHEVQGLDYSRSWPMPPVHAMWDPYERGNLLHLGHWNQYRARQNNFTVSVAGG